MWWRTILRAATPLLIPVVYWIGYPILHSGNESPIKQLLEAGPFASGPSFLAAFLASVVGITACVFVLATIGIVISLVGNWIKWVQEGVREDLNAAEMRRIQTKRRERKAGSLSVREHSGSAK